MKRSIIAAFYTLLVLLVVSCKPSINTPTPSSGTADFSKYIAVGNSLTAGFADGGLYLEGQKVAFPNLLAEQMKGAGGGAFTSPFFDEAHLNGSGYLKLTGINNGSPVLEEVNDKLAYRNQAGNLIKYTEPIQNLGVPGMRLDLAFIAPFGALNNYFERLLLDAEVGSKSYFNYAINHDHTFFTFWLGNNDVLGFATAGGVVTGPTSQLTDKSTFASLYTAFINELTAKGQNGVIATIPDVTAIPFFTTVTIDALLAGAKAAAPDMASQINAIFIQDKTATVPGFPAGVRQATNEDLVVLNFPTEKLGQPNPEGVFYGLHPANPMEDQYILDKAEVARVKDYVSSYNETIRNIGEEKGLALADVYSYLNQVKSSIIVNGAEINSTFITGGAFSLDGIHLTPKGNALIANLFIREINKTFNAKLSNIDVNKYRGVKFP